LAIVKQWKIKLRNYKQTKVNNRRNFNGNLFRLPASDLFGQ